MPGGVKGRNRRRGELSQEKEKEGGRLDKSGLIFSKKRPR